MSSRSGFVVAVALAGVSLAHSAGAAPPWVDRSLTLPRHDWAFNLGLGIAHTPGSLGPGFNLEGAFGITQDIELGFRTGLRFGNPAIFGGADMYGRPFDTETYGTGIDAVANPEVRLRGELIRGSVVELGLEGRFVMPFSVGVGLVFGLPLAFHIGRAARLDTGVFVPILFHQGGSDALVSFPLHLWFQASNRFWLGPLSGVRVFSTSPGRTEVPLGFGLGYSITHYLDFKGWFLFEDVANGGTPPWGFGGGMRIRVE